MFYLSMNTICVCVYAYWTYKQRIKVGFTHWFLLLWYANLFFNSIYSFTLYQTSIKDAHSKGIKVWQWNQLVNRIYKLILLLGVYIILCRLRIVEVQLCKENMASTYALVHQIKFKRQFNRLIMITIVLSNVCFQL